MSTGALAGLRRLRATAALVGVAACAFATLGTGLITVTCPFKVLTGGLNCPFCGGSRMCGALLDLDLDQALRFNAFALVVLVPVGVVVLVALARKELGLGTRVWPPGRPGRLAWQALLAATAVWWVVRDLPFEPMMSLRV
jgi:hypothetical protein